jgi:hypothetical protein
MLSLFKLYIKTTPKVTKTILLSIRIKHLSSYMLTSVVCHLNGYK